MNIIKAGEALKTYFGYDQFRPMQADTIQSIYDKKDVLTIMPTGGGKSMCFQIPTLTSEGVTIVISPLLALMQDQVKGLKVKGIKAAYINSLQTSKEQLAVEEQTMNGDLDILYTSPERLMNHTIQNMLSKTNINLFAIDEAHCISSWGHDFRPEYAQLSILKKQYPTIPIIALTATADALTQKDILEKLSLVEPDIYISSFDRPNIEIEVKPGQQKMPQILEFLKTRQKENGIIYALSRKNTETLANSLKKNGFNAAYYHAGMSTGERMKIHDDFSHGKIQIICATIAFGMGIDKSDIRWVIHYSLPKNIESYYQEIGRAGRDGAPAKAILFYSYRDVIILTEILSKEKNKDVQLHKLDRMKIFAENMQCRKRYILNYFDENAVSNCGNCDNCLYPPQYMDGTNITLKALSAVYRLRERAGLNMLVNVLRGAQRQEIMSLGYDKIKTFGAGRDLSQKAWFHYINQMISLGYLKINFQHSTLNLTESGVTVLKTQSKVQLGAHSDEKVRMPKIKKVSKKQVLKNELFEVLSQKRKFLAREFGIPPYIIFTDKTISEMADKMPKFIQELKAISGVSAKQLEDYGHQFVETIQEFVVDKSSNGYTIKDSSMLKTYLLYTQGQQIVDITKNRELKDFTIKTHLVKLYTLGLDIDLSRFLNMNQLDLVRETINKMPADTSLTDINKKLQNVVNYDDIRLFVNLINAEK